MTKRKFIIEWVTSAYENYLMKLKGVEEPVYISPNELSDLLKGTQVEGVIEKKRTREWFIFDKP